MPAVATDTVPARYISFVGDCYAFLTESHKVAPLPRLWFPGLFAQIKSLPERSVLEIKAGDFIVFPESGEREFVQMVADKGIGTTAPQLQGNLRAGGRDALQKSGLTPEQFHQQAKGFNRPRHPATIRYWFADSSQKLAPREKDDLVLIAPRHWG